MFLVSTSALHLICVRAFTRKDELLGLLGYFRSMSIFVFTVLKPPFIAAAAAAADAFRFLRKNARWLEIGPSSFLVTAVSNDRMDSDLARIVVLN